MWFRAAIATPQNRFCKRKKNNAFMNKMVQTNITKQVARLAALLVLLLIGIPAMAQDVHIGPENGNLIHGIAAGQTQTFVVVSLPKGYRITGYRLVLIPNLLNKNVEGPDAASKINSVYKKIVAFY